MDKFVLERSEKTGDWIKGRSRGGLCFTIAFDRFEEILKTGKIPDAFPNWKLNDKDIERFEIDMHGITVFIK